MGGVRVEKRTLRVPRSHPGARAHVFVLDARLKVRSFNVLSDPVLRILDGALALRVHVQTGASRTAFAGMHGERLKVRLQARPVEGAANEALRRFVAGAAGQSKSRVSVVRGQSARDKELRIESEAPEEAARLLSRACGINLSEQGVSS